jgi:predicted MPP superfamily phosphohydrolase
MAVALAIAWTGAVGWPVALGGAVWAWPRLRRQGRRARALRRLVARFLAWLARAFVLAVTAAWALGVWAVLVEPHLLIVREVRAESAAWRGPPVRIGLIADVHVGNPQMSPARVARIAARMSALEPDLVLLAGDYIGGHLNASQRPARENEAIAEGLAALGRIDAPLGTVAVLGNHDWWYDGEKVERLLGEAGVAVLENSALMVAAGDGELWVAGVADRASDRADPDWDQALAAVPAGADVIGLGHRPDVFWRTPGRVALTAAGHSHCGQVYLPILGRYNISPGSARWPCGLYEEEGRLLYVSGGVGVSGLPARFRAPPEIVVVTLTGQGEAE